MSKLDYIGVDDLVFNDIKEGIYSGGFNVKSIMMKAGMSPIMTVNTDQSGGGEKVSDLFNNLVIPNWTLSYNNCIMGGKHKEGESKIVNDESDDEDDVIDEDLHEKLLELVKEHNTEMKKTKKKTTRRMKNKKGGTKRKKV
jgi:hypothetical protein